MIDISETFGPKNTAIVNYDNNASKKNNYTTRPQTFSGDSTEFE
jgi:hypothetical protein